jgi:fructokinase
VTKPALSFDDLLVVGLGEVLFDCFQGHEYLGGAPLNFAIHANQLLHPVGGRAIVASRVGADPLGDRLLRELANCNLSRRWLQVDDSAPTGTARVISNDQGHSSFDIKEHAAWDFIGFDHELEWLARRCSAVCFGTLSQRSTRSRDTIQRFLETAPQAIRMCDLNLRAPFFDAATIEQSLMVSNVLKVNDEELQIAARVLDLNCAGRSVDECVFSLSRIFELDAVVLTRGAAGTVVYAENERVEMLPVVLQPEPDADSIGAGDACDAAVLCGTLLGWPLPEIVAFANEIGAFVASRAGATPTLPPHYLAKVNALTKPRGYDATLAKGSTIRNLSG